MPCSSLWSFTLPRHSEDYGAHSATLIVRALWTLWDLPQFLYNCSDMILFRWGFARGQVTALIDVGLIEYFPIVSSGVRFWPN